MKVGDIQLEFVQGDVLAWNEIKDYYDLSVTDNFDEIVKLKDALNFFSEYAAYSFVNQSKNVSTMEPVFCNVIREK